MPEDYENQRGNVKKLLLKLKELYSENLFNNGLQSLITWIIKNLSSEPDLDTISYDEAHHKLRSITSAWIQLYKLFYNDFGYIIGCFVLSLLSISNDLTTTLILLERLHKRTISRKLHCKLLSYPDLYDNPLRMLKYTTNRKQIDSVIDSMHMQMQELVRLEVGERRDKDLQTKETDDMKGLFKIAITPQVEHLMKISKSIFDKTKSDKEKEEEQEREEIELNFPTYKNEFDRDKLFDNDPNQNVDYELPTDEPNFLTIRSFRSIGEKKKWFYKLLKTYKALLQKKTSILHQNEDINTMTQSAILIENFQEVTFLLTELLSRPALEKTEETFSSTEAKILNLKIKRCFEALIEESRMNETKITLQVSSKDLPGNYNFYEDPNFSEIKLVYAPMIKIIHRCLILLEDWGDHPILVDTIAYWNKVLSLHWYLAPLQKVLTGLELILGKLQEYQKIAWKLNTVQDHINTLKLLIIRYRKIQIISWKHMMNSKLEIALVEDFDNFIWLTYALNTEVIKESGTDYDKVFDAVDLYIRDSNLSQFSNRLLHINILRDQIAYASINNLSNQKSQDMHNEQASPVEKKGIANILHFVYMYYTQLKGII